MTKKTKKRNSPDSAREKIQILYEDDFICVINKAPGILSVPYPGGKSKTAISVLEEIMQKRGTYNSHHRPFAVHRLDRETSGVMMFALSEKVQKRIMDEWHTMVTERLYRAVAENPQSEKLYLPQSGIIDDELAFNAHNISFVPNSNKKSESGETEIRKFKTVTARTHYKIIESGITHTLFELSLDTGRKNQIRAHLAGKGYPLAGDENYRARTDNFKRLCLHARTLEFVHPYTHETLKFEVPEPKEWLEYVKKGDLSPRTPEWIKEIEKRFENEDSRYHAKKNHKNKVKYPKLSKPMKKHLLSRKQRAHMNFIEAGISEV